MPAAAVDLRPVVRRRFRAMGTDVELLGVGVAESTLAAAAEQVMVLERRWSRFRPDSELCRLNARAGAPVVLAAETFDLVAAAVEWSRRTGGWFDPTVLGALEAAGYGTSHELLAQPVRPRSGEPSGAAPAPIAAPGVDGIDIDPDLRSVRLPPGVGLDLGGIGKGWTADLLVDGVVSGPGWVSGAGICANLGGDLRACGAGPGDAWVVAVEDPFDPARTAAVVAVEEGAVATSATTRRRWSHHGADQHHLIDPRTSAPSSCGPTSVTTVAASATEAEVWAKVALLAGPEEGSQLLRDASVPALVIDGGGCRTIGGMEAFLW